MDRLPDWRAQEEHALRPVQEGSAEARFRQLLQAPAATLLPGAMNALAARIIEDSGFEAIYVTGAGLTNANLGMPDLGLITATELAEQVARIRDVTELPLVVDADTGFGNALNTRRTVRSLERAGASVIQLEDQTFPKKCGHFEDKSVVAADEMVMKIQAAVDARSSSELLIMARTDAAATHGIDEAIERAGRYREAGADISFVEGPRSREDIARIGREVDGPKLINLVVGGKTPLLSRSELAELGYALVLYANAGLQAAILAMQQVYGHLKQHGDLEGIRDQLAGFAERQRVILKDHFDELDRKYALGENQ